MKFKGLSGNVVRLRRKCEIEDGDLICVYIPRFQTRQQRDATDLQVYICFEVQQSNLASGNFIIKNGPQTGP